MRAFARAYSSTLSEKADSYIANDVRMILECHVCLFAEGTVYRPAAGKVSQTLDGGCLCSALQAGLHKQCTGNWHRNSKSARQRVFFLFLSTRHVPHGLYSLDSCDSWLNISPPPHGNPKPQTFPCPRLPLSKGPSADDERRPPHRTGRSVERRSVGGGGGFGRRGRRYNNRGYRGKKRRGRGGGKGGPFAWRDTTARIGQYNRSQRTGQAVA